MPMTIPDIVKACQTNMFIAAFPVPIITTKKLAIGEWVNRYWEGDVLHVGLEMLAEKEQITGITKERITKEFKKAGFKVIFQEPGTMKKGPGQEEKVTPPPEQTPEPASNNSDQESLF